MKPLYVGHRATSSCGGQSNNEIIPAIPTEYRGIQFKSRLEARFAEWLDENAAGPWFYEWEEAAICDEGGYYLPDFYVEDFDLYVEVKPEEFIKEMDIHWDLIRRSGEKLIVVDNIDREWRVIRGARSITKEPVVAANGGRIGIVDGGHYKVFEVTPGFGIATCGFFEEAAR